MSGLNYSVGFENVAVSTVVDLLEGLTPSGNVITIHRIEFSDDATSLEQLRVQLLLRSTAGSGGTSVTPRAKSPLNSRASAVTWNRTVTTPGTAGNALTQGWRWGQVWNFDYVLGKPQLEIEIPSATRFALALLNAPTASKNFSVEIDYEER